MTTTKQRSVILAILVLLASPLSYADSTRADRLYQLADQQYDLGDYETAVQFLKMAIQKEPNNSNYHHLLAKSYGRIAEDSNWISAMELSQKTRKELELAVHLDDTNIPAINDLISFYRKAPGFLGGSLEKADILAEKIERLQAQSYYSPVTP